MRFAVIGEATAAALKHHGYNPDLMPDEYTGAAMARCLAEITEQITGPLLAIRAESGSTDMFTIMDDSGIPYEKLELYRLEALSTEDRLVLSKDDLVILASASGVRTFFDTYGPEISDSGPPGFACIGQYTAEQLAEYGAVPSVMADIHSAEGLAASVKQYFDKKGE